MALRRLTISACDGEIDRGLENWIYDCAAYGTIISAQRREKMIHTKVKLWQKCNLGFFCECI